MRNTLEAIDGNTEFETLREAGLVAWGDEDNLATEINSLAEHLVEGLRK